MRASLTQSRSSNRKKPWPARTSNTFPVCTSYNFAKISLIRALGAGEAGHQRIFPRTINMADENASPSHPEHRGFGVFRASAGEKIFTR